MDGKQEALKCRMKCMRHKKGFLHSGILDDFHMVGATRFELAASCTPSKRSIQAELRPER